MPIKDPEARRAYHRKWLAERRQQYFRAKICVSCGSPDQLELDHIDPTQKISHSIWSWSEKRRSAELRKCQILCSPCHAVKTAAYLSVHLSKPTPHGTHSGYSHYGCRCDLCREAHNRYQRRWRT